MIEESHGRDRHIPCVVALTLLVVVPIQACKGETSILVEFSGDAASATTLNVRLVDDSGLVPGLHTFPAQGPLQLPGSVLIRTRDDVVSLGVVAWTADAAGRPLARASTDHCVVVAAGAQRRHPLSLAPVMPGWSPQSFDACRCRPAQDGEGMCSGSGAVPLPDSGATGPVQRSDAGPSGGRMDAVSVPDSRAAGGSGGRDTAPVIEPPGSTGDLFGFERAAPDWSSAETTVTLETGEVEAGAGALAFTLAGTKAFIRSRAFSTSEMGMAGPRWTLSVFVGQTQTDQNASIRLWFDCPSAGLNNQFVDYQRLPAVAGQWAPMVFQVPGVVTSALTTPREGCRLSLEHVGSGLFRYDDLRFAP